MQITKKNSKFTSMNKQQKLRDERKGFKDALKIHLKTSEYTQRMLCAELGILENEFHNLLTGFQSSVPSKGIKDFDEFKQKVCEILGENL